MSGKWIALLLVALGIALLLYFVAKNPTASYDDGTFLIVIAALLAGIALVAVGVVWLIGLVFAEM